MEPKITNLKQLFIKNASNYLLTNDKDIDENDFIDKIAKYLNSGVKIIEYIPSKSDRYSLKIAKKLRQLTSMFGALLLIKGRCDILKIAKADGIAFDEADFDIDDILKIVDNDCYFSLKIKNENDLKNIDLKYIDIIVIDKNINKNIPSDAIFKADLTQDKNFIKAEKYDDNR